MLDLDAGVWLATAVYRRTAGSRHAHLDRRAFSGQPFEDPQYEVPNWTIFVILANLFLFFPVLFVLSYTFKQVFPVLAMIEDEKSGYEPVLLDEAASNDVVADNSRKPSSATANTSRQSHDRPPVTSSFRGINRLLRAHGGFGAYFRGFFCLLGYSAANGFLYSIFASVLPRPLVSLALLVVSLALVQLSTAWVHIVITPQSSARFWQRLPPFRRTFDATARPTALFWLALQVTTNLPILMAWALGVRLPDVDARPGEPTTVPAYDASDVWKSVVIALVAIIASVFLVVPAQVVLVRVQASLLPESDDTILPFDRSFGGAVVPAVVDGKGYATITDAWRTFTPSAWRRLIILYVKIFLVNMGAMLGMALVLAPQVYVIIRNSTIKDPSAGSV